MLFSRKIRMFLSRDFRMREACRCLPEEQRRLVAQLDAAAMLFRQSVDNTTEVMYGEPVQYALVERATAAREERDALAEQCALAGVPKNLIDYFGSLSG